MAWEFSVNKPIFEQISDRIILAIISGKIKSGEKIEAVRDLAVTAGVNPNTVQRALASVEQTGLIYTKRGEGRYVTEDENVIISAKSKYLKNITENFINTVKGLGIETSQIVKIIKESEDK